MASRTIAVPAPCATSWTKAYEICTPSEDGEFQSGDYVCVIPITEKLGDGDLVITKIEIARRVRHSLRRVVIRKTKRAFAAVLAGEEADPGETPVELVVGRYRPTGPTAKAKGRRR